MSVDSSPWFEAWYIKLIAVGCAGGLIYAGQLRYERGLKEADQALHTANDEPQEARFMVLQQVDFAGLSREARLRLLNRVEPGLHFAPLTDSLSTIRGLISLAVPPSSSRPLFDSVHPDQTAPPNWSFELVLNQGRRISLFPLPTPVRGVICLCVPYSTTREVDHPTLSVMHSGDVVESIPLSPIKALPKRDAHLTIGPAPVTIQAFAPETPLRSDLLQRWAPEPILSPTPPRYRIKLDRKLGSGETAFVKLVGTEYADASDGSSWTEFKDSVADVDSPSGLLAKSATVRIAIGSPRTTNRTITAPLGSLIVRYGQPVFFQEHRLTVPITPTSTILLPTQGANLKRPPRHLKRAIHITIWYPKDWTKATGGFPDLIQDVKWVSPDPGRLGLEAIWLPWAKITAKQPIVSRVAQGPVNATLDLSLTTLKVSSMIDAVVPIQNMEPRGRSPVATAREAH